MVSIVTIFGEGAKLQATSYYAWLLAPSLHCSRRLDSVSHFKTHSLYCRDGGVPEAEQRVVRHGGRGAGPQALHTRTLGIQVLRRPRHQPGQVPPGAGLR